jgi:hypothetical protein
VILGWWLDALGRLSNQPGTVKLRFMDGPYEMRVSSEAATWTIDCVKRVARDASVFTATVDSLQLISETLRVGRQVVEACDARGWQSPDVEALRDRVAS